MPDDAPLLHPLARPPLVPPPFHPYHEVFDKLKIGGDNYLTWRRDVRQYANVRKLAHTLPTDTNLPAQLTGTPQEKAFTLAILRAHMDEVLKALYDDENHPSQVWTKLESVARKDAKRKAKATKRPTTIGPNTLCFACGKKGHIGRQCGASDREKLEYLHKKFVETRNGDKDRPQVNNVEIAFGGQGGIMFGEVHCTMVEETPAQPFTTEKPVAVANVAQAMERMEIDEVTATAKDNENGV
ncbi:hypothetical protein BCR44DRAFT_1462903 [Catenaria anguillulae PL171]|uniref:CCHC-type domain-containing protein n=1 Tax=Catenaria anguillulae PL171 TaxID=765915 RepID=A0A1Y2HGQ2_9FUNG|nr:hypothetical protein BCR44DRAFT_1462903 [Catenaria anguillulae PL171]